MGNENKKPYVSIRQKINERKASDEKKKKIQFSDFLVDVKRNPMILIGLGGSAILTALAGLFIGLAPRLDDQGILILFGGMDGWGAAAIGILFGVLYAAVFPIIGEWGTYYWHKKASLRDIGNKTQAFIGYGMLGIAGAFTVITAVAASIILASLLHTFTAFNAIPEWAQKWTVLIIPISLALHAGANIWYDHVSQYAEERREMDRGLQTVEIEAENRIRQARIAARERAAIAMAEEYENLSKVEAVETGKKIAKEAWKKDKVDLGGDHDGDGIPNAADPDYDHTQNQRPARQEQTRAERPSPQPAEEVRPVAPKPKTTQVEQMERGEEPTYHPPMTAPVRKAVPEKKIWRGEPFMIKSVVECRFVNHVVQVGDEVKVIENQDHKYLLFVPGESQAFDIVDYIDVVYLQTGNLADYDGPEHLSLQQQEAKGFSSNGDKPENPTPQR